MYYGKHWPVTGACLTNPLQVVPFSMLHTQLTSDGVLLVRRQDIISRWSHDTNLSVLLQIPDPRWRQMNVLGRSSQCIEKSRGKKFNISNNMQLFEIHMKMPPKWVKLVAVTCMDYTLVPDVTVHHPVPW